MIVTIRRQADSSSESCLQKFEYEAAGRLTAARILEDLNSRDVLKDIDGNAVPKIGWECSCLQQMCGACAMVINGRPALACAEFIDTDTAEELTLEPLSKFPVIRDLMVDRSSITEHQKMAEMYLGERAGHSKKEHDQQYLAARCIKCGLCLEICPNYVSPEGSFYGAVLANEAYLLCSSTADRKKEITKQYKKHFGRGCSKALLCRDICPMKIPTLSSIGYMNRK